MRALALCLVMSAAAACSTERCKPGTLLLTVSLSNGAEQADALDVSIAIAGGAAQTQSVAHPVGSTSGSIEVDFASGYPTGQSLDLTVTARAAGQTLATASRSTTASAGCTALPLSLDGGGASSAPDLSAADDLAGTPPADLVGTPPADLAGTPPADLAGGFAATHVTQLMSGAPDVVLSANPSTIDTDALTVNGATSAWFVKQAGTPSYAVLYTRAFSVQNHTVISGSLPLIVVASDVVTITASIDLYANLTTPGPGALTSGSGAGGAGASFVATERESSGGGGGSYGSLGGPGGTSDPTKIPAGGSGLRYGMLYSDPLVGGSPGGAGGYTTTGGGAGGGALQISSAVSISIASTSTINAGGGGGKGGGSGNVGGGGGGAGGELFFEAPSITCSGTLVANGGGGGGGGANGSTPATDGSNGNPGPGQAGGGTGGIPQGSPGGKGAAGPAGAFLEATAGDGSNSKGGGGGGGAGRIFVRYRAATPPSLDATRISPPAVTDATLP